MEADVQMDVQLDVATPGYVGRLEVVEGPTGRRLRTEGERARIAAESLMPGAQVAVVARKYGTTRSQVYDWRRRLRLGELVLPESAEPLFAPLLVDDALSPGCRESHRNRRRRRLRSWLAMR